MFRSVVNLFVLAADAKKRSGRPESATAAGMPQPPKSAAVTETKRVAAAGKRGGHIMTKGGGNGSGHFLAKRILMKKQRCGN